MTARTILLACAVLALQPKLSAAQRSSFAVSPEYAGDVSDFVGGLRWGARVKTFTARLDIRSAQPVSPWVTTGLIVRDVECDALNCLNNGWLLVAGLRIDAAQVNPLRPYIVAGAGAAMYNGQTVDFLPSVGGGIRWTNRGTLMPRLEARWERYNDRDYAMIALGIGLVLGRPVSTYR